MHSGSALGGHYYAYIKSSEDGKWRTYNDSEVREITLEDVTNVFGDKHSSATAYMLKYRQYNPESEQTGAVGDSADLIPEYLRAEIDSDTNKMIEEQKQIEERLYTIKLKVHPEGAQDESGVKEISVRKD